MPTSVIFIIKIYDNESTFNELIKYRIQHIEGLIHYIRRAMLGAQVVIRIAKARGAP